MTKEVEAKAWLDFEKKQEVFAFLQKNAVFVKSTIKEDSLFVKNGDLKNQIRLRRENDAYTLTKKNRTYSPQGVEINDELEFIIENLEGAKAFLQSFEYDFLYSKKKQIEQYQYDVFLCEVVHIAGLGDFLEIETFSEKYISELMNIFQQLGLENEIEKRPYGEMVAFENSK